jgi:hypothetical protein
MSASEHMFVYLFHLLFVSPLFLYIGYKGPEAPKQLFTIVMALGAIIGLYHGFKLLSIYRPKPDIKVI